MILSGTSRLQMNEDGVKLVGYTRATQIRARYVNRINQIFMMY